MNNTGLIDFTIEGAKIVARCMGLQYSGLAESMTFESLGNLRNCSFRCAAVGIDEA